MSSKFLNRGGWAMCAALACGAALAQQAPMEAAAGAKADPSAAGEPAVGWEGKALFVESRSGLDWAPWAMLPLSAPSQPAVKNLASPEPSFGVDPRADGSRRVEIWCAGAMWAWDGLAVGSTQQLEFGCGPARYRAQIGAAGSGAKQAMKALADRRAAALAASVETSVHQAPWSPELLGAVSQNAAAEAVPPAVDDAARARPPESQ